MTRLDSDNQEMIPIYMDHAKISMFPTRSDPLFIKIVQVIRELLINSELRPVRVEQPLNLGGLSASIENFDTNNSK